MDGSRGDEIRPRPVVVVSGGRTVALQALKQRQLLAALLAAAGTLRSGRATRSSTRSGARRRRPRPQAAPGLRVEAAQGAAGVGTDRTQGSGYAVDLADGALDAARFERLLDEGSAAARRGEPGARRLAVRRALALWRGDAYGEFADEAFARPRPRAWRSCARSPSRSASQPSSSSAGTWRCSRSSAASHEQPLRERLQAQLMLALYRCGRQSRRWTCTAPPVASSVTSWGWSPERSCASCSSVSSATTPASPARAARAGRRALPAPPTPLVGRERELAELVELLTAGRPPARPDGAGRIGQDASGGRRRARMRRARSPTVLRSSNSQRSPIGLVAGAISHALGVDEPSNEPLDTRGGARAAGAPARARQRRAAARRRRCLPSSSPAHRA